MSRPEAPDRDAQTRRLGLHLEYATIGWNVAEAVITIWLGIAAGSLGLIAFGLDSVIEVFASGVVVWHTRHPEASSRRTNRALRLIALSFLALAAILTAGAVNRLISGAQPGESILGVGYLALTVVVMFTLARLKQRAGLSIGDRALVAEARITYLDAALAFGVLLSLLAYSLFGWAWADPAAALLVAAVALREGLEALRGEDT